MTGLPKHLSPSGFSMFRQCPAKWWHHYMEDHPRGPATVEQVRGTFVHFVLEHVLWMPPAQRTIDAARHIARHAWNSWITLGACPDFTALNLDDDDAARFAEWTWLSIQQAFLVVDMTEIDVVALELKVDLVLGGVPFFGYIDLVETHNGKLDAGDWKTGERPDPSTPWYQEQRADKVAQPLLYAAALRELGHEVDRASLIHIPATGRSGEEMEPATDAAMDNVVTALAEVWAGITELVTSEDPQPSTSPSTLCAWCDFVGLCPEGQVEVKARHARGKSIGPAAAILGLS